MVRKFEFIYQPYGNEIDEEKVRRVRMKIAEFLVKKTIEKTANDC